jgi:hypothetical protein
MELSTIAPDAFLVDLHVARVLSQPLITENVSPAATGRQPSRTIVVSDAARVRFSRFALKPLHSHPLKQVTTPCE